MTEHQAEIIVLASGLSLVASWALFFLAFFGLRRLSRRLEPIEMAWRDLEAHLKQRFLEAARLVDILDQFAAHEVELLERLRLSIHSFVAARTIQHRIRATDSLTALIAEAEERGRANRTLAALGAYRDLIERMRGIDHDLQPCLITFEAALFEYNEHLRTMRLRTLAKFLGFTPVEGFRSLLCKSTTQRPTRAA